MFALLLLIFVACPSTALADDALNASLQALIDRWQIPGGSVSLASDRRVVHTQTAGLANPASSEPVRNSSLFRIASVSKTITAVAILRLAEQGRLGLDQPVFDLLPQYRDGTGDSRANRITIRHLLQHSGGWDSALSGDPVYPRWEDLHAAGSAFPPDREQLIAFWLLRPLDFEPGARFAYSNFGYLLLGRVVEAVTKTSYELWTARNVLEPGGFQCPRIGSSVRRGRARREVVYTDKPGAEPVLSVFSPEPRPVPEPYGGFSLDLQDSAGGWLASAPDLARFLSRLTSGRLLQPATLDLMVQRPSFEPPNAASWYGLGFQVFQGPAGVALAHDGSFAGSAALVLHLPGFVTAVALFNSSPRDYQVFLGEVQNTLLENAARILAADVPSEN
jgi:N-acyl-D-amino-acid deacylase